GRNLRELVGLPSTDGFLRRLGAGLADALAALHEHGLLHRDLKPENIFVGEEGDAIVTDFGLSALIDRRDPNPPGSFTRTLGYAAPGGFPAGAKIGPAADLYGLGLVLYELATGVRPQRAEQLLAGSLDARFEAPSTRNRSLSYFLDQVIAGLLEIDPARRLG